MIKIFSSIDKDFSTNGDIVINPIKAKVFKADNGDYYLTLEADIKYIDYFVEGNIVVANTPTGEQAFRISNVVKTKSKLSTKAYHVFYDSENYLIADSYVVEKTCNEALAHLNNATEPQTEFTTYSNVGTIDSYRCVRKSFYEAIMEVVGRWGGHLVRDNFKISILSQIGTDNGIIVQYRKNLKEITCSEDWSSVVTKILPVGKDGTLLNAVDPSADIYITSSKQYTIPYTKTVSFSQDINKDDYPTEEDYKIALVADLREQASRYLEANNVPQVNYNLKANLEKLTDIGDTVEVIDRKLGIDFITKVISFEYDCISERYTQVEFGNFTKNLSNLVSTISKQAGEAVTQEVYSDLQPVAFSGSYDDLTNKPVIPTGVQSDWDVTDPQSLAYILHKPTIPAEQVQSDWDVTDTSSKAYIKNKPTVVGQVNSDWNATSGVAEILNKPTIPTDFVSKANGGTFNGAVTVDATFKVGGTSRGILQIIGNNTSYYGQLYNSSGNAFSANRNFSLPNKSGTLALTSDIPTDTNQLNNGAGFITSAGSCAYATNADTVDGSHAWNMQTLNANGQTHGASSWVMKCQHNVDGDGRFKIVCGDGSLGTKVDYANNAGNASKANIYNSVQHLYIASADFSGGYYDTNFGKNVLILAINAVGGYGFGINWGRIDAYKIWRYVIYIGATTFLGTVALDIWYVDM